MLSDKAVDLSTSRGLEEFKRGTVPYGLCHGASVGHGIDGLQEHCYTITHFGHDWSLDNFDQINERIGPVRQFQSGHTDRLVRHNMILARDTVDEEVTERRASKRDVQDVLLEAMKRRNKR
jgi:hypothetical protein